MKNTILAIVIMTIGVLVYGVGYSVFRIAASHSGGGTILTDFDFNNTNKSGFVKNVVKDKGCTRDIQPEQIIFTCPVKK